LGQKIIQIFKKYDIIFNEVVSIYKSLIRPILFKMDPEKSHNLIKNILRISLPIKKISEPMLNLDFCGIKLNNPLGLAAGFDKNADMLLFLSSLNLGYITIGSVLLNSSKGNPKPRIIRYDRKLSLVNSMGLPSEGLAKVYKKLRNSKIPLFISIAGNSVKEYVKCYSILSNVAKAIELNISCPNTENGRLFQDADNFKKLINEIVKIKSKPTFVKVSPPLNNKQRENLMEIINVCMDKKIEGITAINTIQIKEKSLATGFGGLSGKLIYKYMLKTVRDIYEYSEGKIIINACGGIFEGKDAFEAIINGATTVQIYTALIYEGFGVIDKIIKELKNILKAKKFSSIKEAIGYAIKN
jgi:dihydroorotate dehydrogenase (subfamily 1) family protein